MKNNKPKQGISLIAIIIIIVAIIVSATSVIVLVNNNQKAENEEIKTEESDIPNLSEKGENKEEEKTNVAVNDTKKDYTTAPTIPNGFEHVKGTEVATGYVIRNSIDGNEFVWVPVEDISDFVREEGYCYGELQTYVKLSNGTIGNASEPLNYDEVTANSSETEEYNAMKTSVEKYKGFYIGRYETSNNGSGVAQSKANQEPWTSIKWGNSMTDLNGGAVEKARAVYPVQNAIKDKDAVSTLVYGVQWDATVRFIKTNYPEIEKDSKEYGNYDTFSIINTGSNESYKLNNIYDMAGNCYEWTMEAAGSGGRVGRGGFFYNLGTDHPVSYRSYNLPTFGNDNSSFRLALYIK